MTAIREVQNLTQLEAINDGKTGDQVWVIDESTTYTACPPGTGGAVAGRNCGWMLGDNTESAQLASLPQLTVPKKLGSNIVSHAVHYQLTDFGNPIVEPFTVRRFAGFEGLNNSTTWAANDAAFSGMVAAIRANGGYGLIRIQIRQGRYYVSQPIVIDQSFVIIEGLGEGVEICYLTGGTLGAPLLTVGGADSAHRIGNVQLSNIWLNGQYATYEALLVQQCNFLQTRGLQLLNADNDHHALKIGDGCEGHRYNDTAIQSCQGIQIDFPTEGGEIDFDQVRLATAFNTLMIDGGFNLHFRRLIADQQPQTQVFNGSGLPAGYTCPDDAVGVHIKNSYGSTNPVEFDNCWVEHNEIDAVVAAQGLRVGTGLRDDSGQTQLSGIRLPNWRIRSIGPRFMRDALGNTKIPTLQTGVVTALEPVPTPSANVTWNTALAAGVTTLTTECTQYFSLPFRGSGGLTLGFVRIRLDNYAGTNAKLEFCKIDTQTGGLSVVSAFTLANGENQFSGAAYGDGYLTFTGEDSGYWNGVLWSSAEQSPLYPKDYYVCRVRVTPGSGGAATIHAPTISGLTGTNENPTVTPDALLNMPSGARRDLLWTGDSLSNLGSLHGMITLHGTESVDTSGIYTAHASSNADYAYFDLGGSQTTAFTLACKLKLIETNQAVAHIMCASDTAFSKGVGITSYAGRYGFYIAGVGWVSTSMPVVDTNWHSCVLRYDSTGSPNKLELYVDNVGVMVADSRAATLGSVTIWGALGGFKSSMRGVVVLNHWATTNELARLFDYENNLT